MKNDMHREWELEGRTHRTRDDAVAQVNRGKTGSLVAATDTYLFQLAVELRKWLDEVNKEIAKRS